MLNTQLSSWLKKQKNSPLVNTQSNIAEYLLYLWQMQDVARATNFDVDAAMGFYGDVPADQLVEERRWFAGLCATMKEENVIKSGHISEVHEILKELVYLHSTLITSMNDEKYQSLREAAKPALSEFLNKTQGGTGSEVEAYLTALYGWLLLRLRSAEISPSTEDAMKSFSAVMAYLSEMYRQMKLGEMNLGLN